METLKHGKAEHHSRLRPDDSNRVIAKLEQHLNLSIGIPMPHLTEVQQLDFDVRKVSQSRNDCLSRPIPTLTHFGPEPHWDVGLHHGLAM
jgi:hypothetical protein